ncbi:MAG: radical SAM protein [Syntrophomonadaceae bacterium]|nr:radical SAM protein [Dysgonamonadaceae bacterium]MDD3901432.1 radical SAM protein [Dysgonamonadaceae bacterium]MDD4550298.1 radical SAM protein [Syntrophomonadaceae bacterium]
MKIPQLRILATTYCGRRCIYCRPTGEGIPCESSNINIDTVIRISKLYKQYGGNEIKFTGGDPIFWDGLSKCIKILKQEVQIENIEIITRSPTIIDYIPNLISSGLDKLDFSLDTLSPTKHKQITGIDDLNELIDAITQCVNIGVKCKINTVVMNWINREEIFDLICWAEKIGIRKIKLLDVITDLHDDSSYKNKKYLYDIYNKTLQDLYVPLSEISQDLRTKSISERLIFQGGLGHPMNCFKLESGLEVIVKDHHNGAWYGELCISCVKFPCHDALMALRLTSDEKLQFCLLNENISLDISKLDERSLVSVFDNILDVYRKAFFVPSVE